MKCSTKWNKTEWWQKSQSSNSTCRYLPTSTSSRRCSKKKSIEWSPTSPFPQNSSKRINHKSTINSTSKDHLKMTPQPWNHQSASSSNPNTLTSSTKNDRALFRFFEYLGLQNLIQVNKSFRKISINCRPDKIRKLCLLYRSLVPLWSLKLLCHFQHILQKVLPKVLRHWVHYKLRSWYFHIHIHRNLYLSPAPVNRLVLHQKEFVLQLNWILVRYHFVTQFLL